MVGQPGQLEGVAEPAAFADADFLLQDQVEEVEVAHGLPLGPVDQAVQALGRMGEPESFGVLADAGGDQFAHDATPASWS